LSATKVNALGPHYDTSLCPNNFANILVLHDKRSKVVIPSNPLKTMPVTQRSKIKVSLMSVTKASAAKAHASLKWRAKDKDTKHIAPREPTSSNTASGDTSSSKHQSNIPSDPSNPSCN